MNHDNSFFDILSKVAEALKDVLNSGLGAFVAYIYLYSQTKTFSVSVFFVYMVVGFFIGYTVGMFIPHDVSYRDGLLCFIGVGSYSIFGMIESKVVKTIVEKYLKV